MSNQGKTSRRSVFSLCVIVGVVVFFLWSGYFSGDSLVVDTEIVPGQEELITKWIGLSSDNTSHVVLTEYPSASSILSRSQKRSPVMMFCVIGVQEEIESISHFLHYNINVLKISPDDLMIALNSDKLTDNNLKEAASILYQFGVRNFLFWEGLYSSQSMFRIRHILFNIFTNAGRLSRDSWVMHSDADEFHGFPEDAIGFLRNASDKGYNVVMGVWRDRLADKGSLNAVVPYSPTGQSIFEQFPVVCNFRTKSKVSAYKAYIDTTEGNHNIAPSSNKEAKVFPHFLNVHHFKVSPKNFGFVFAYVLLLRHLTHSCLACTVGGWSDSSYGEES
jgi:hypothetical protein